MAIISEGIDPWLLTLVFVAFPRVYSFISTFRNRDRRAPSPQTKPVPSPLRRLLTAILVFHTLYTLHTLIFARPPNVFTSLGLPLSAPQSRIRSSLMQKYAGENGTQALSPAIDRLLTRLASFEVRTVLVRYGQRTVESCTYCTTVTDYAIHFLPMFFLSYTGRALLLGVLTTRGSARERRRLISIAALVGASLGELYWAYTVEVSMPRAGEKEGVTMWHDTLFIFRQIFFLLLMLGVHLSPPAASPADAGADFVPSATQSLKTALARAHLLRYTTAATRRAPALASRARDYWEDERHEGWVTRTDDGVQAAAEAAGLGIGEGLSVQQRGKGGEERRGKTSWENSKAERNALGLSGVDEPVAAEDLPQQPGMLRATVRQILHEFKALYNPPTS